MKNKIKYSELMPYLKHKDLLEDFKIALNPTPYDNLPNGEYLIRGNKKSHSKEYWVFENVWYLVATTIKDNGHWYCISAKYNLFPMLPLKEYEELTKHVNRLSELWQRNVYGFNCWLDLRSSSRDISLNFYKLDKRNFFKNKL